MKNRHFEIGIDELVLEGFAVEDGERIRGSVERELTHLFADQGIAGGLAESYDITGVRAEQITMGPRVNAAPEGKQIARAIYGAINTGNHKTQMPKKK